MNYIKKLGLSFLITLLSIFILSLLLTTFYYFNLINSNVYNILKLAIIIFVLFINSIILGKKAPKYGLLEGLKLGTFFLIIMLVITSLTKTNFSIRTFIYSIIILLTTGVGGVIGINKKEKK